MFWNYLLDATEKSITSAKNLIWLGRSLFLMFYLTFCIVISIVLTEIEPFNILLIIFCMLDFLAFATIYFMTSSAKRKQGIERVNIRKIIAGLTTAKTLLRLTDSLFAFICCVISFRANNQDVIIFQIVGLIISVILLLFNYSKEVVYMLYRYFKYKTTERFRVANEMIKQTLLERVRTKHSIQSNDHDDL